MLIKTTVDLLDDVKKKYGLQSDYALAKHLGWAPQRISNYRAKRSLFDDESALQVARALDVDAWKILNLIHVERASKVGQGDVAKLLAQWLRKVASVAVIAVGVGLAGTSPPSDAAGFNITFSRNTHWATTARRWWRAWWARFALVS